MKIIDNKIKEKLEVHGFSMEDLTYEELEELKKEIKAELNGKIILDGVLAHKDRFKIK